MGRPSVNRQPPSAPPVRCSDGSSDSNMQISKTTELSGGRRGRSRLNSTARRRKKRETNMKSLPDELLFDILVRVPADVLHDSATFVCRKWCHIICSDVFTTTHIQQHSTYGLVLSLPSKYGRRHSIYVTATQGRIEKSEFSYISQNKITANGLAVHFIGAGDDRELHVINPATKLSFRLPRVYNTRKKDVYYDQCGIAYCAASMKYKVTLPYYNYRDQLECLDIVTVAVDKSWRRVEIPPFLELFRSLFESVEPLRSEGFLHWGRGRYCLTLNVETEIVTLSEAPIATDQSCEIYYLSTGSHLSLLVGRRGEFLWEVWEMENGHQWRKVLPDIDLEAQKCSLEEKFGFRDDNRQLVPLGWVKYPEVLAFCSKGFEKTCICYNLETCDIDKIDLPQQPCSEYKAFVHRNSMEWLSQDA